MGNRSLKLRVLEMLLDVYLGVCDLVAVPNSISGGATNEGRKNFSLKRQLNPRDVQAPRRDRREFA